MYKPNKKTHWNTVLYLCETGISAVQQNKHQSQIYVTCKMRMAILNTTPGLERYPVIKRTIYMLRATGNLKHVQCYRHVIYKRDGCQQQLQQGLATLSNSDTIKENVLITLAIIPRTLTALNHGRSCKFAYSATLLHLHWFIQHLTYSISYSVVPIHSLLLTVPLYSSIITIQSFPWCYNPVWLLFTGLQYNKISEPLKYWI